MNRQAEFWCKIGGGAVRCELCPHHCTINDGAAGLCGVRANSGGTLSPRGYGEISSIALDPIEKKPLRKFHPGKRILSIGGFGCNLRCPFCQNHEISMVYAERYQKTGGRRLTPEYVAELAEKSVPDDNIGVAYTYNEPLIAYEFLSDCAKLVRETGLCNVLVTNGFINTEPIEALLPYIDAMNIDLKSYDSGYYEGLGGKLEVVKDTIVRANRRCHVEVTTLVIADENEDDVEELAQWLGTISPDIPLHLSRFFPRYRYSDREPTPRETIARLYTVAKKYLSNVYT